MINVYAIKSLSNVYDNIFCSWDAIKLAVIKYYVASPIVTRLKISLKIMSLCFDFESGRTTFINVLVLNTFN